FATSGALLFPIWALSREHPQAAAIATYLHVAMFGPVVISLFWLTVGESFEARSAKRLIQAAAGIGALGGAVGGAISFQVGATAGVESMLLVLGAVQILCGALLFLLRSGDVNEVRPARNPDPPPRDAGKAMRDIA